jgi:hypothetical protein
MRQRTVVGLTGLILAVSVVVAVAAGQTFEEALWGPGAFLPGPADESYFGTPDDLCDEPVPAECAEADLDIEGVADEDEDTVGAFLGVNNDDDDGDGVVDYDDGYNKDGKPGNEDDANAGENDLVLVTLRVMPEGLTGKVVLRADGGGDHIRLWTSPKKGEGNRVVLPKTYDDPADLPRKLYLEAVAASRTQGDVQLVLKYTQGGDDAR